MQQEAPVLLCDEATSALDSRTEKEILDSLLTLAEGRTSIFVAHRLSTAAQCDKIVVLENVRSWPAPCLLIDHRLPTSCHHVAWGDVHLGS